jgi:trans-2,3-dihydro-3-hydroxyanthranilate isomerase
VCHLPGSTVEEFAKSRPNSATVPAVARYLLFDVFTDEPYAGNQLAVFPDAAGIDPATMQRLAGELNLAESVFLTATGDASRPASLRIFTPGREMPFAGHPTIGTAIAIADVLRWIPSDRSTFVLQEQIGDVAIQLERGARTTAWLTTPPVSFGATFAAADAARLLGVDPGALRDDLPMQIVSAGNPFLYVALRDVTAVDDAQLDVKALSSLIGDLASISGVFFFAQRPGGTYARMLAPMSGIAEDPATGSATGPLFAYLLHHGAVAAADSPWVSEQGVQMGRRSLLHVRVDASAPPAIAVGGSAVHVGEGSLFVLV